MILDCVHWRRTVEDVGIDELYRRIDPYDVRSLQRAHSDSLRIFRNYLTCSVLSRKQFPGREELFESWPMGFHKVRNTYMVFWYTHSTDSRLTG